MNILGITKDIEKSFRRQSVLTIVAVGGALVFALVVGLSALSFAERQRSKIYVLDQGKSLLLALQTDAVLSKDVEIRDHVTRFHELMFTLSPQKQTIQENLDRAFNLADRSAFEYSQDLAEKGYYSRIVSANISQQMLVDSVVFAGSGYPWQVKTYARQYVVRESKVSLYSFVSTCQVIEGRRSDANPHGLLIERFKVISNDLIETRKR
ncbi:MAG: conjugative transposon protein TraK [Bacteroidales bacterium]|nr:conjugative transposon protein TraK [Bacteroidales bacterium]